MRGSIAIFGAASGPADPLSPNALMGRSLTLAAGNLGDFTRTRDELLERARGVMAGVQAGWLKLRIERVLPLGEAEEAHRLLEGRQSTGKLLLSTG